MDEDPLANVLGFFCVSIGSLGIKSIPRATQYPHLLLGNQYFQSNCKNIANKILKLSIVMRASGLAGAPVMPKAKVFTVAEILSALIGRLIWLLDIA
jgi:hypothetical protein